MKYTIIIEEGNNSFGAYVPELPGCAAVGESEEEALRMIRESIEMHLSAMKEEGAATKEQSVKVHYYETTGS